MQSLKQVLEMKNQQIHLQEKKIVELEKLVSWPTCSRERVLWLSLSTRVGEVCPSTQPPPVAHK